MLCTSLEAVLVTITTTTMYFLCLLCLVEPLLRVQRTISHFSHRLAIRQGKCHVGIPVVPSLTLGKLLICLPVIWKSISGTLHAYLQCSGYVLQCKMRWPTRLIVNGVPGMMAGKNCEKTRCIIVMSSTRYLPKMKEWQHLNFLQEVQKILAHCLSYVYTVVYYFAPEYSQ